MKPTLEQLLTAAPDLDPAWLKAALLHLPDEYFMVMDRETQIVHLRLAAALTREEPVFVLGERLPDAVRITVIAFDAPGEFSWITGIMASQGANVRSGDGVTFAVTAAGGGPDAARRNPIRRGGQRPRSPAEPLRVPLPERRIIDVFELLPLERPVTEWSAYLQEQLRHLFGLFFAGSSPEAVRETVNNHVAESLRALREPPPAVLQPLQLQLGPAPEEGKTRLAVHAQDTPAFLYCLGNALAANGVYIHSLRIRTVHDTVLDSFLVTDNAGRPLESPAAQERLRLAVQMTRQFSHFLGSAADPYKALVHFNTLLERFGREAAFESRLPEFRNPALLRDLAVILGAGDYLWEEFIRLNYEKLLPLLGCENLEQAPLSNGPEFRREIRRLVAAAATPEERKQQLNQFKDFEIFRIDLEHLLNPGQRFPLERLGRQLSELAEAVMGTAAELALDELRPLYGEPHNLAGRPCAWALMGLGKLGGRELGFASDLELLLVYRESGRTTGPGIIPAEEFFCRLADRLRETIQAKRQGIFELDFRLRPHGNSGPLAVSLESFCRYYSPQGEALDYERQALVKMRFLSGDNDLGGRLESFRDEILYHARNVRYGSIDELRQRQHRELAGGDRLNAKFSAGGLVDIEYAVQFLQILHGEEHAALRTANTREALNALGEAGYLSATECTALLEAHQFQRQLVNALRMLRGNARDLEIPTFDSLDFLHLARRMGYRSRPGLGVAVQLRADLGGHMARVRDFCRRRFGQTLVLTRITGNLADVALTPSLPREETAAILSRSGFRNITRAAFNLRQLLGEGQEREVFAQLIVLAEPFFRASADPDMALNNWERYARNVISRHGFHESLLREPTQFEIFINLMAVSQFLADVLIRNPEYFSSLLEPDELRRSKSREDHLREIRAEAAGLQQHEHILNALRRTRRRQLLRIGTRDLCLDLPLAETVQELSWLADGLINTALEVEARRIPKAEALLKDGGFCLVALGKLGGVELNYSSDIDLLAWVEDEALREPGVLDAGITLLRRTIRALTVSSEEGHMYRVDMRLRPFGAQGVLLGNRSALEQYYAAQARPWEFQALLKARPVCGPEEHIRAVLARLLAQGCRRFNPGAFAQDALAAREQQSVHHETKDKTPLLDIKTGPGGIRDAEFAIQLLQIRHLPAHPQLLEGNTLSALNRLVELDLVPPVQAETIRLSYILLRRIEHLLQIMHDRQVHALALTPDMLRAVARRLRMNDPSSELLQRDLEAALAANAAFFRQVAQSP